MSNQKVDEWVYDHASPVVEFEAWSRPLEAPDRCSYTPPAPGCFGEVVPLPKVEPWVPPELDPSFKGMFAQKTSSARARDLSVFDQYEKQNDNNNNLNALKSVFSWQNTLPSAPNTYSQMRSRGNFDNTIDKQRAWGAFQNDPANVDMYDDQTVYTF